MGVVIKHLHQGAFLGQDLVDDVAPAQAANEADEWSINGTVPQKRFATSLLAAIVW